MMMPGYNFLKGQVLKRKPLNLLSHQLQTLFGKPIQCLKWYHIHVSVCC